jgi:hypothetical protein
MATSQFVLQVLTNETDKQKISYPTCLIVSCVGNSDIDKIVEKKKKKTAEIS